MKEKEFCERVILAVTYWNYINVDREEANRKADFFKYRFVENMTQKLGFTGENKIKNVIFFSKSKAEVQSEI